jgi:flavin reductase (DIM6/NTAB) family NADH-FMN oxidoreductase RutF
MLGVNIGRKAGARKDTAVNMLASREFVVNIGHRGQIAQIHESAAELPPEVSEAELLGVTTAPSQVVRVPRIADAPVAMECRLAQVIPFGDTGAEFYVGEVIRFHLRDGLRQNNRIDTLALDPVCRIGGPNYATLGEIVSMRPVAQTPKSELRESDA